MADGGRWVVRRGAAGLLAAALLAGWVSEARATILTFDQERRSGEVVPTIGGGTVPQDYGDRVAGPAQAVPGGVFTYGEAGEGFTPNVVVDAFAGSSVGPDGVSLWHDNYGDLINVAFANNNSLSMNFRLAADPGFVVLLHGFDLAGWPNADYTIRSVRVLDGVAVLYSESDVLIQGDFSGPRHTPFAFAAPLAGAELLIEVDFGNLPGGQHDNIGIDNIRFGQSPPPAAVPGPPGAVAIALGLAGLPALARRAGRRG